VEIQENIINNQLIKIGFQNPTYKLCSGGFICTTLLYTEGSKKAILKKYKNTRKLKDILFELDYLDFLNRKDFSVPKRLCNPFKIGKNYYVFFNYLPGTKKTKQGITQIEFNLIIRTISKIHKLTKQFRPNYSKDGRDLFTFWFDDFVNKKYYKTLDDKTANFLINELEILKSKISNKEIKFKKIVIHNDLWLGNIKFSKNKIHLLDFDDCCLGAKISDLAVILIDLTIYKNQINKKKLNLALKLYCETNKLSKNELEILPFLLRHRILVHCNFYLTKFNETKKNIFKKKFNDNVKLLQNIKGTMLSKK
jgi:Ser/Thr protein kinase RdoA (MazF antagonist)